MDKVPCTPNGATFSPRHKIQPSKSMYADTKPKETPIGKNSRYSNSKIWKVKKKSVFLTHGKIKDRYPTTFPQRRVS